MPKFKKLIFIDDDRPTNVFHQIIVEESGLSEETIFFDNAVKALDYFKEMIKEDNYTLPDFIFLDINMPVMNGLDSSREIRNIGLNTPIIALTAINAINPEKDFGSYGIDDAIVKPYKTEQLLELLLKYIN